MFSCLIARRILPTNQSLLRESFCSRVVTENEGKMAGVNSRSSRMCFRGRNLWPLFLCLSFLIANKEPIRFHCGAPPTCFFSSPQSAEHLTCTYETRSCAFLCASQILFATRQMKSNFATLESRAFYQGGARV